MGRYKKKVAECNLDEVFHNTLLEIHDRMSKTIVQKEKVNDSLKAIQTLIDKNKLSIGCKVVGSIRSKVINLYNDAKLTCEDEEKSLRELLSLITKIHKIIYESKRASQLRRGELMQLLAQHARFTPLWVGQPDEHPCPLVGGIAAPDSMPLEVGWEVAAYVDNIWMLAEVVAAFPSGGYEVKDIDDEQKTKYTVRRSRLIPLPHWRADPLRDSHALFPINAIVLALYPQTTCFYKGVIERVPETAREDYMIAFEDSSFPQGYSPPLYVPQRYVVTYKVPRSYKRRTKKDENDE